MKVTSEGSGWAPRDDGQSAEREELKDRLSKPRMPKDQATAAIPSERSVCVAMDDGVAAEDRIKALQEKIEELEVKIAAYDKDEEKRKRALDRIENELETKALMPVKEEVEELKRLKKKIAVVETARGKVAKKDSALLLQALCGLPIASSVFTTVSFSPIWMLSDS